MEGVNYYTNLRTIRCPIHDTIKVSDVCNELINTEFFKRLHYVSQLSTARCVYPGATHTRASHSIGAMKIAGDYARSLIVNSTGIIFPENFVLLAEVCALLHDIGHGPFSHSFDRAVYSIIYERPDGGHDVHRGQIVRHPEIADILTKYHLSPDEVCRVWGLMGAREPFDEILFNITQGPLGADRLDFTKRDATNVGTLQYGNVPISRFVSKCKIILDNKNQPVLAYNVKLFPDIKMFLDGRRMMYRCVYLHQAVSAASITLEKLLKLLVKKYDLVKRTTDLEQFKHLDDSFVLSVGINDPELAPLISDVRYNRHPQLVKEFKLTMGGNDPEFHKYLNHPNCVTISTRAVGSFSAADFAGHNIVFYQKLSTLSASNDGTNCYELVTPQRLETIENIIPEPSTYFYRIYACN